MNNEAQHFFTFSSCPAQAALTESSTVADDRTATYFGKRIPTYINEGPLKSSPSKLIMFNNGKVMILRK